MAKADDRRRLEGRIAGTTIAAGELVTSRTLRRRAASHGLRAMSIPIDPARAVGGRLGAGDRVDVLFAGQQAVSIIVADAPGPRRRRARPGRDRRVVQPVHGDDRGERAASPSWSRQRSPTARSRSRGPRVPTPRAAPRPQSLDRVTVDDGSTRVSAPEPSVALVFSPELWVEELHRHLVAPRRRARAPDRGRAVGRARRGVRRPRRERPVAGAHVRVRGRGARVRSRHPRRVRSGRTRRQGPPRRPRRRRHHRRPTPTSVSSSPCCSRSTRPPHRASDATGARPPVVDARDEPASGVLVAVSGPRGSGVTEVALGIAVALAERRRVGRAPRRPRSGARGRGPSGARPRTQPAHRGRRVRARSRFARRLRRGRSSSTARGRLGVGRRATRAPSPRRRSASRTCSTSSAAARRSHDVRGRGSGGTLADGARG